METNKVHDQHAELNPVQRVERIYLLLEYIAKKEASAFSDSGKANLRRAQAELQRLRLFLQELPQQSGSAGEVQENQKTKLYDDKGVLKTIVDISKE